MDKKTKELYEKTIQNWGMETQLIIACEECGELIQAISKFYRERNKDTLTALTTEIADVEIMLDQLRIIASMDLMSPHNVDKMIERVKRVKIERLKLRCGDRT